MDYETKIYLDKLIEAVEELNSPDWWTILLTAINTIAVIVIAVAQIRLQKRQAKAQEYDLYRRLFSQVYELDFFNKTILLKIVAILTSNEDKKLRLKLIEDIWKESEILSDKFNECTIDMELKQCGEGLDAKYYYDALQASKQVVSMFRYFVEEELVIFNPSVIYNIPMEYTTPLEDFVDVLLKLFRGNNAQFLRSQLLTYVEIVKKMNDAQLLNIIKDRITPNNKK